MLKDSLALVDEARMRFLNSTKIVVLPSDLASQSDLALSASKASDGGR